MKRKALALALILVLLVSSVIGLFCVISNSAFAWNSQTVDARSGLWSSLALDSNNNPHISYSAVLSYNKRYGDFYLMYAGWNGSAWDIQTLGLIEGIDFPLRLDSTNSPHIIFGNNSNLMYAKLLGSNWIFQTVDTGNVNWGSIALSLDSNGNPHISYCKDNILKYASWTNSSWKIQTVDSQEQVGFQSSIALDENDYPQIFYGEEIYVTDAHVRLLNLKYAAWTGSAWDIQTVATNVSQLGNIALDSNECPHICYVSADIRATLLPENKDYTYYENDVLKYVYRDGLVWKTQTVAQGDAPYLAEFRNCYLALDSGNNPHMTFYGEQYPGEDVDNGMKYASWAGLYWHIQDVNSSAIYSGPVALDSKGIPHVSYCTLDPGQTIWQQGDLVYAVPVEPFSTPEPFQTILTITIAVLGVVIATIALVVVVLAKLLVYYRKK